jgi:2-polyprenyl-3-methyl-5-hydroxy-6-metoxy-1,4-benzoquinol methylase
MGGIIEHLYDPAQVLSEVFRLLRPEGWLYFDAPNEDGLYMQVGNFYMRLLRKNQLVVLAPTFSPFHVQGFNPESLQKLAKRCGLVIRDLRIFGQISPQTGNPTFRKRTEHQFARLVNGFGNLLGKGMYMEVWAQKREM